MFRLAGFLACIGLCCIAIGHAQMPMSQASYTPSPSAAASCSPNGCSGDLATAGGGLTLLACWSTWACTGAGAAANTKLYHYACTGGSPASGDVLATTGTGAPNTAAMISGCGANAITITKVYQQGTVATWDMDQFGALGYNNSCANSNPCFTSAGSTGLRTTNSKTLGALPISLSGVMLSNNTGGVGQLLRADTNSYLALDVGASAGTLFPTINNGTVLTSTVGGNNTHWFVVNGVATSGTCTLDVEGTTNTGSCGSNTHTANGLAGFNLGFSNIPSFIEFLIVQGDFSANIPNARASQCNRWHGLSC